MTAYGLYCENVRLAVQSANPGLHGKDITRIIAEQWDEIKRNSPGVVKIYQARAEEANADFEERMRKYEDAQRARASRERCCPTCGGSGVVDSDDLPPLRFVDEDGPILRGRARSTIKKSAARRQTIFELRVEFRDPAELGGLRSPHV